MASAIGFIWGLLEALWFFVVPDVGISLIATRGWKPALYSTIAAVLGAMLGAVILFLSFTYWPASKDIIVRVWSSLPGFYDKMLEIAHGHLAVNGAKGLIEGPTSGIPYRFYVLEALKMNLPMKELLLWTPLARLERIVIAPVVVLVLRGILRFIVCKWWPRKEEFWLKFLSFAIVLYWIGIYVWYWGYFLPDTYKV